MLGTIFISFIPDSPTLHSSSSNGWLVGFADLHYLKVYCLLIVGFRNELPWPNGTGLLSLLFSIILGLF